ncbi:MAG: S-adenosylmethionine-dependent methyltransferase [Halothiobacillaceae bacterium]|nr:MAG: S-adenosylmethionine-dependent methyltransferase [Halothiobacillaceae bacterium]
MMSDRNFDDLSHKFRRKIYASPKGIIRLAIVWEDLITALPDLTSKPLRVLDVGSGIGQISLALAKLGHELVLCDHSNEMLTLAKEQFKTEAPDAKVTFIHSPIQQLTREIEGQFDLVLCHAVLEWLATPRAWTDLF